MSINQRQSGSVLATSTAPLAPSLLQQVGMAGTAAVITVTFIHPIDVVKVSMDSDGNNDGSLPVASNGHLAEEEQTSRRCLVMLTAETYHIMNGALSCSRRI